MPSEKKKKSDRGISVITDADLCASLANYLRRIGTDGLRSKADAYDQIQKKSRLSLKVVREVCQEVMQKDDTARRERQTLDKIRDALAELLAVAPAYPEKPTRPGPRPPVLFGAPAPLPENEWVERGKLLDRLTADWDSPYVKVAEVCAPAGEGKSSVARKWLARVLANSARGLDGIFWWSFYSYPSVDAFLSEALVYVNPDVPLGQPRGPDSLDPMWKARLIADAARKQSFLFVLDGTEVIQKSADGNGDFKSEALGQLLAEICAPRDTATSQAVAPGPASHEPKSFCLITTQTEWKDGHRLSTVHPIGLKAFEPDEGLNSCAGWE